MLNTCAVPERHTWLPLSAAPDDPAPPAFLALVRGLCQQDNVDTGAPNCAVNLIDDDTFVAPTEWSEEDLVLLHWRLLKEIGRLADPETPLDEKFDTLRWVFTEHEKDDKPFSFVSCLRVVGCSPLSPLPYCGLVDAEALRDFIRSATRPWLRDTLMRYPAWVREAVIDHPEWVESRLARNPQSINEAVRRVANQGDLFA